MQDFIKIKLREALGIPSANVPANIQITPDEASIIKSINYNDIILEKGEQNKNLLYINVSFTNESLNNISAGIKFQIQLIHNTFFQPHMFLSETLQGLGLGYKIFKCFINKFGHIYCGKGRTVNTEVINKILGKLSTDPEFIIFKGKNGILIATKDNPNIENLKKII